jgi:hypothetical protein
MAVNLAPIRVSSGARERRGFFLDLRGVPAGYHA